MGVEQRRGTVADLQRGDEGCGRRKAEGARVSGTWGVVMRAGLMGRDSVRIKRRRVALVNRTHLRSAPELTPDARAPGLCGRGRGACPTGRGMPQAQALSLGITRGHPPIHTDNARPVHDLDSGQIKAQPGPAGARDRRRGLPTQTDSDALRTLHATLELDIVRMAPDPPG